jgi:hypothetical protein
VSSRILQPSIPQHLPRNGAHAPKLIQGGGDQRGIYNREHPAASEAPVVHGLQVVPAAFSSKSCVLNSWKEIATYLGRGVRTVQRWESELRLPVHRPRGKNRSAVLAFREELDDWLRRTPSQSVKKDACHTLIEIERDLRTLDRHLTARADPQAEWKQLMEQLNAIVYELTLLMNGNSGRGHSH